ncbi:hypothetical protein QFZ69_003501 [Arthrobacter sp. V1I7]|nr:hypothetical protein [Arthrobacter sp. V1I7]
MGEQPGAVDALPVEGVVGHPVDLVPGDLLGQEPFAAGGLDDLREGCRVAERVRKPRFQALHAELVQEEALAFQELAGHRLTARHVGVRLDPHATHGNELAGLDLFPDAPEQLRVIFLDPGQLLGRGAGKHEPGILVNERDHVGERPGALADGLPHRPQPGGVEMRMSGGEQPVRRGVGRPGQDPGERGAAGGGGSRDVVGIHQVQHALQRPQDFVPARQFHRQFVHESAERPDVLLQLPDGLVELGNEDLPQPVFRLVARRRLVSVGGGREGPSLREVRVRRGFDVEIHGHSAAEELQRDVLVPRGDSFDDGPVGPPGDAFALESRKVAAEPQVHDDFHRGVRLCSPGGRHFTLEPKPGGAPGPAPGRKVFLRCEVLPEGLQNRDRFIGDLPAAQRERDTAWVNRGDDAFAQKAVQPDFRETAVVVQCVPLSAGMDKARLNPVDG